MELVIRSGGGESTFEVEATENAVMEAAGKWLLQQPLPVEFEIECEYGMASYSFDVRRTQDIGSTDPAKMHIREKEYHLRGIPAGGYPEKYLTCIDADANRYKFYKMVPASVGIEVEYGRIGDRYGKRTTSPYDHRFFWLLYYEKLLKGYVDNSDVYLGEGEEVKGGMVEAPEAAKPRETHPATPSRKLFQMLLAFAKSHVRHTLVCDKVTPEQAMRAREIFGTLAEAVDVAGFNEILLKLMAISPRAVTGFRDRGVKSLLARSESDFAKIVDREEALVLAMEAVAGVSTPESAGHGGGTDPQSFEDLGITVEEATEVQRSEIVALLDDELKPKVSEIYRVVHPAHKARFDAYCTENGINDIRRLWHGSRNCNFLSIIRQGLLLNPNAQITGKMFGHGIYFAPRSLKSWGYTSFRGTYWARGGSDTAIMGLYECAYGKPHDVWDSGRYDQEQLKRLGKNCVHAHAGRALRNDEIVFYDEAAMLLNYIVVFK